MNIVLGKSKILELSPYEKTIIYSMFNQYNHTVNLRLYESEVLRRLQSAFIIERTPGNFPVTIYELQDLLTPYVLQPWVG